MGVPVTKEWEAWINLMPGGPSSLIVTGRVETNAGNMVPQLTEAKPQGINPKILILDLAIVQQGDVGTSDVAFRDARFTKPAGKGEYTQVEIRFDNAPVALVDVKEAH